MGIAHLPLDLGLGDEGGDRVDHDDVQRPRPDEHVGDLQGLLAGIRLGDDERVGVHAELLGVLGVQGVLGVDEGGDAPVALGVRHGVEGDGGLPRGLGAVDFHDASARQAADAQGDVEGRGPRGDDLDFGLDAVAQAHDRAFAELAIDLGEGRVERLGAVFGLCWHRVFLLLADRAEQVFPDSALAERPSEVYAMPDLRQKNDPLPTFVKSRPLA